MKLEGRTAVITGASRGLGKALVQRFLEEGASVACCARTLSLLQRLQLEFRQRDRRLLALACDIADRDQVDQFSRRVLEEFGAVDVLINNAALLGSRTELVDTTPSMWARVIEVNVNGVFYVTRAFLLQMIHRQRGSIINVTSSVGRQARARWGAYAVSKFAVEGFTQVLADELKAKGIRVNAVNPGAIATDMRQAAYPEEDPTSLKSPSEITDIFVYLASDESRSITGQSLDAQKFTPHLKGAV